MTELEKRILCELQKGLPLETRPYLAIAEAVGCKETDVLQFIEAKQTENIISRFGLIIMHRTLGYEHNAMVVWDIPDNLVDQIAGEMANYDCVNLCYRRPRVPPDWPYNLFCMIHAKSRGFVYETLKIIQSELQIDSYQYAVLFSEKAYKQRGAKYV